MQATLPNRVFCAGCGARLAPEKLGTIFPIYLGALATGVAVAVGIGFALGVSSWGARLAIPLMALVLVEALASVWIARNFAFRVVAPPAK